ncbi:UDP-3-O-(3-hydroxymyristoyl)glucosamine N-acyltransferase [Sulfuriferula nivalis]|uniref:UDP-3-O-(3-hydroxymyristoyl)glucosamine N-acyltransferase n=1 Tax=Sulfuriferula nivalis TaxID=2675298 RepID=UPI00138A1852|nr:UDP-3-O-(3-hydroxymyristoyl)glucosamine N-acyltransferase [Sulfuriferula nivalis]
MSYSLKELTEQLGGSVQGNASVCVTQVASLAQAQSQHIAFLANPKYREQLASSHAGAFILARDMVGVTDKPCILADNPYTYFAKVSTLFNPPLRGELGIHERAVIHPSAVIGAGVSIAANVVIERDAVIGAGSSIAAGSVIGQSVQIGTNALIYANVTIYPSCVIGSNVILHSGCVIGADGFGLAPEAGRWLKIPQIGRVIIGDDVEVGANTTIDRGALDDTVIHDGVKLDNQIQVAHNVHIGEHTAIAACTGIAGSAHIGAHCTIGGAAMIFGHIEIADKVNISTNTLITKSLPKAGTYTSALPFSEHSEWLKNAVQMRHLDSMAKRLRALEQQLASMEKKND